MTIQGPRERKGREGRMRADHRPSYGIPCRCYWFPSLFSGIWWFIPPSQIDHPSPSPPPNKDIQVAACYNTTITSYLSPRALPHQLKCTENIKLPTSTPPFYPSFSPPSSVRQLNLQYLQKIESIIPFVLFLFSPVPANFPFVLISSDQCCVCACACAWYDDVLRPTYQGIISFFFAFFFFFPPGELVECFYMRGSCADFYGSSRIPYLNSICSFYQSAASTVKTSTHSQGSTWTRFPFAVRYFTASFRSSSHL